MPAVDRHGQAGRQILPDSGLEQPREHRVGGDALIAGEFEKTAVLLPQDRGRRQRGGYLLCGVLAEPDGKQAGQTIPVPVSVTLVGEVRAERFRQCGNGFRGPGDIGQIAKMPGGQRDNHERHAVTAGELLAVLAVDRVAEPLALRPVHHGLGEESEISGCGEGHILERQPDRAAFAGGVTMAQRGRDGKCAVEPAGQVPCRQHMVDRGVMAGRPGDERKAGGCVHRIVNAGRAVCSARHLEMNQVGPLLHQRFVGMPFPPHHIRHEHAGVDDQALDHVLSLRRAHVRRHGTLALVQSRPVDARPVIGNRPAVIIRGAADRVDPDDFGTELGQSHPGQRHRDETGNLHDPNPGERLRRIRSRRSGHPLESIVCARPVRARRYPSKQRKR